MNFEIHRPVLSLMLLLYTFACCVKGILCVWSWQYHWYYCLPAVASGYRVSFNATFYMATIAAATALGTPVINFTVYFDPTYFQSFEAVVLNLVQLSSTGRSAFSLENGESTNVITFADDGSSLVLTVLSRTIHYSEVIAAGEYELSLSVTVVGQRGSDVESVQEVRSSLVRIGVEGECIH